MVIEQDNSSYGGKHTNPLHGHTDKDVLVAISDIDEPNTRVNDKGTSMYVNTGVYMRGLHTDASINQ